MRYLFTVIFCCWFGHIFAQTTFNTTFSYNAVPQWLNNANQPLPNAWFGGFNSPQFSRLKLNADDVEDLFVFDRTNNKCYTFVAQFLGGQWQFVYQPEYEAYFPEFSNWVLLRDYNCDGKKDIFTHSSQGIKVYQNNTIFDNPPSFDLVSSGLISTSFAGNPLLITVDAADIPSILDVDNDGDLDLITFEFAGSTLEWHKNMSQENNGNCNALTFRKNGCWGEVAKASDCGSFLFNVFCKNDGGGRKPLNDSILSPQGIQHNGASSLVLNLDGDADLDVLVGEFHCNKLSTLTNTGTAIASEALFTQTTYGFPNTNAADFYLFPTAYHEDLDFDGLRDLLVAPNVYANDGDLVNFAASAWRYKNTGTENNPTFVFQQADFLQGSGIDLGEEAAPAFADFDADGDLDLFVGNRGLRVGNELYATLYLYENIGTPQNAQFKLLNSDYMGLGAQRFKNIRPYFTKLNSDNATDLVIMANSTQMQIYYALNNAAANATFNFTNTLTALPIACSLGDFPTFTDLNADGKTDLLVGRWNNRISQWNNTSTDNNLTFSFVSDNFKNLAGSIGQNISLSVADFDLNGQLDLLAGSSNNKLRLYYNFLITPVLNADTTLFKSSLNSNIGAEKFGNFWNIAVADLNQDLFPDLAIGQKTGGLTFRQNTTAITLANEANVSEKSLWTIFPNPANEFLEIGELTENEEIKVEVYNALGQAQLSKIVQSQEPRLDIRGLANGLYALKLSNGRKSFTKKILVQH